MTVGTDYSSPVTVNGFQCKNCTDVGYAKKHIDPAHPRSGPYGIFAKDDPSMNGNSAVTFGGALSGLDTGQMRRSEAAAKMFGPLGAHLDVRA